VRREGLAYGLAFSPEKILNHCVNEEEVKINNILPFLKRLGFQAGELKFETSFFLKVGRHNLKISADPKNRDGVGARLDILVTRNGDNLFIVEVKEADHALTDADRDQAISYARLVHPIAPFALLTNGTDWQLFDSVTKHLIGDNDFKLKGKYEIALPEAQKDEALSSFLGFSPKNLNMFCESQVNEQLKPLIGSPTDVSKKFVPELTVTRVDLHSKLERFQKSDRGAFLLLANSGMGKTSALCNYALELLRQNIPVLFFRGWALETGILNSIADEFNWTFSEQQNPVVLFKRLKSILKDYPIVILLDAIDEWQYQQKVQNLFNVLKNVRDQNVKFVISCKSGAWKTFAESQGSHTGIEEYLYHIPTSQNDIQFAYFLGEMEPREFYEAIRKYRNVFKFAGAFEDRVLDEAKRNPFLLRVLFVVASQAGLEKVTFSSAQLFEEYYKRLMEKTGNPEIASVQIEGVAKAMWDENRASIEISVLRKRLGLGINDTLLPALFEHNILICSADDAEHIGFSFQQLRDFIIYFKALGWQKLDAPAFKKAAESLQQDGIQAEVLSLYFRHASPEHKRILCDGLYQNAQQFLRKYTETLESHFPSTRDIFEPHTKGRIGFIGELFASRKCLGGYGFRKIEDGDDEIFFIPTDGLFSKSNLSFLHGATRLHYSGSAGGFRKLDIRYEVVEHEIISQLETLVKTKQLSEDKNHDLLYIRVRNMLFSLKQIFSSLFEAKDDLLQNHIQLERIEELLLQEELQRFYRDQLVEEKRKRGEIREIWANGGLSYSFSISSTEQKAIDHQVQESITKRCYPTTLRSYSDLRHAREFLRRAVPLLNVKAVEFNNMISVERHVLFDALRHDPQKGLVFAKDYLTWLFEAFLENYKILVDENFPSLKGKFKLRNDMPVCLFIGVASGLASGVHSGWWGGREHWISCVFCKDENAKSNSVIACDWNELPRHFGDFRFRGVDYKMISQSAGYMDSFLLYTHTDSFGDSSLHNLVYRRIHEELPAVLDEFRKVEGLKH